MTPEERAKLEEVYQWMQQRKVQQLSYPVDQASKNAVGAVIDEGTGATALTDSIALTGNAQTINVPKAYSDTEIITIGGKRMEIPVIQYL